MLCLLKAKLLAEKKILFEIFRVSIFLQLLSVMLLLYTSDVSFWCKRWRLELTTFFKFCHVLELWALRKCVWSSLWTSNRARNTLSKRYTAQAKFHFWLEFVFWTQIDFFSWNLSTNWRNCQKKFNKHIRKFCQKNQKIERYSLREKIERYSYPLERELILVTNWYSPIW